MAQADAPQQLRLNDGAHDAGESSASDSVMRIERSLRCPALAVASVLAYRLATRSPIQVRPAAIPARMRVRSSAFIARSRLLSRPGGTTIARRR